MTQSTQSLIEFPCDFSLKVMGKQDEFFVAEILKTVCEHVPNTTENNIRTRPSSQGNYMGATVTIWVESQVQLDNVYRALTSHPMVKVVL